jgi:hypothetical protein
MAELFRLETAAAVRLFEHHINVSAIKDLTICADEDGGLERLFSRIGGANGTLEAIWWQRPEMPKADRVAWADVLVTLHHPASIEMWLMGLGSRFARLGGALIGSDICVNVFGRGLQREGFRTTKQASHG